MSIDNVILYDYIGFEPLAVIEEDLPFEATHDLRQAIADYHAVVKRYAERNVDGQVDSYLVVDIAYRNVGDAFLAMIGAQTTRDAEATVRAARAIERQERRNRVATERRRVDASVKLRILKRDGYRCVQCGSQYDLEIDHKHPVSRGGTSVDGNLQTLCRECNSKKGAKVNV